MRRRYNCTEGWVSPAGGMDAVTKKYLFLPVKKKNYLK
jgi:hypothetical protein